MQTSRKFTKHQPISTVARANRHQPRTQCGPVSAITHLAWVSIVNSSIVSSYFSLVLHNESLPPQKVEKALMKTVEKKVKATENSNYNGRANMITYKAPTNNH